MPPTAENLALTAFDILNRAYIDIYEKQSQVGTSSLV